MKELITHPGMFRLLLALAVVAAHMSRFEIGRLAVLMFFLLSGYWVSRLWVETFRPSGRPLAFYSSRYLRIMPLYLLVLAAIVMVFGRETDIRNWMLLGVASSKDDPVSVSWSLDIELQFYLLVPLFMALLASRWSWVMLPITAAGWWVAQSFGVVTVAQYLPAFALGAWIYTARWTPSNAAATASLAGFLAFTAASWLLPWTHSFLDQTQADPFDRDLFSFLWMLPLVPYIAASLNIRSGRIDRDLGNISYPLYLVHPIVVTSILNGQDASLGMKAVALTASLAVAAALYYGFDRMIEARRRRMFDAPSKPLGSSPGSRPSPLEP